MDKRFGEQDVGMNGGYQTRPQETNFLNIIKYIYSSFPMLQ